MLEISSCLSDTLTVVIRACLTLHTRFSSGGFLGEAGPSGQSRNKVSQVKEGPVMSTEPHGLHGNSPGDRAEDEYSLKTPLPVSINSLSCHSPPRFYLLAKNLFHRAISESGVALAPGLVKKDF